MYLIRTLILGVEKWYWDRAKLGSTWGGAILCVPHTRKAADEMCARIGRHENERAIQVSTITPLLPRKSNGHRTIEPAFEALVRAFTSEPDLVNRKSRRTPCFHCGSLQFAAITIVWTLASNQPNGASAHARCVVTPLEPIMPTAVG